MQNTGDYGQSLGELYGTFLGLPALRGLWYAGDALETGNVPDMTGQARTLTHNGTPTVALLNSLVGHYVLNGTTDFFSRATEAGLNIVGTETTIASAIRGITLGLWVNVTSFAAAQGIFGKMDSATPANWQYGLHNTAASAPKFAVGATPTTVTATNTPAVSTWSFMVGRYTPSTELAIFVNGTKTVNTTSIPASIPVPGTPRPLTIGEYGQGAAGFLGGKWGLAFLCAAALPDAICTYLWSRARAIFAV